MDSVKLSNCVVLVQRLLSREHDIRFGPKHCSRWELIRKKIWQSQSRVWGPWQKRQRKADSALFFSLFRETAHNRRERIALSLTSSLLASSLHLKPTMARNVRPFECFPKSGLKTKELQVIWIKEAMILATSGALISESDPQVPLCPQPVKAPQGSSPATGKMGSRKTKKKTKICFTFYTWFTSRLSLEVGTCAIYLRRQSFVAASRPQPGLTSLLPC